MNQSWVEVLSYDDHISMVQVRKASIDTLSCCWRISIIPTNPSLYWNIELKWSHLNDSDRQSLHWSAELKLSHFKDSYQQSLQWNVELKFPLANDSDHSSLNWNIELKLPRLNDSDKSSWNWNKVSGTNLCTYCVTYRVTFNKPCCKYHCTHSLH